MVSLHTLRTTERSQAEQTTTFGKHNHNLMRTVWDAPDKKKSLNHPWLKKKGDRCNNPQIPTMIILAVARSLSHFKKLQPHTQLAPTSTQAWKKGVIPHESSPPLLNPPNGRNTSWFWTKSHHVYQLQTLSIILDCDTKGGPGSNRILAWSPLKF